ncbi:MAG: RNA polymerase subunit sigma-70 [Bacteroidetes bacterium]|nr:MAG: RNA polymerase subunit sigma-70 [Bacteroidota bacterium]
MQGMLTTIETEKLLKACKKGSYKARSKVYKIYAPMLLGICLRYTKNKSEAEDVLHEGFIKIYTKIDQAGRGSFEGWMKKIIMNEALQFLRNRNISFKRHEKYELDYISDLASTDDVSFEGISTKTILDFIQKLPEGYRLIFNLYVFEEYSHKQIAELLNISEGTSKSQYSRAKSKLKKSINDYKDNKLKENKYEGI